ncbi:helix-turn-helix domain-containing protein [Aquicoccus sp. SCR17]|nr:helix-turn-helix domain-containing protein [Carideicomes alvinocaridis]
MSFRPGITSFLSEIRPVEPLRYRAWGSCVADLWEVEVGRQGFGEYVATHPRLVAILDREESPMWLQCEGQAAPQPVRIAYVPAGLRARSSFGRDARMRHVDLHFDQAHLCDRLRAGGGDAEALCSRPVLLGEAPQALAMAELIGEEIRGASGSTLVLDSLVTALLAKVLTEGTFGRAAEDSDGPRREALSFGQLDRLDRLMQRRLHGRLSVAEMAAGIGLSESWFAHAYRQSRGETPLQTLRRLRIDTAKRRLAERDQPLADIAAEVGFADQAHFTRAFRSVTGQTPGAWRRMALSRQDRTIHDSFSQDLAG